MFRAAVGHSDDVDPEDAALAAVTACERALEGATPSAAIAFAGLAQPPEVLARLLAERHPGLPIVGCTAMAEVSSDHPLAESSYLVMMLASDRVSMAAGVGSGAAKDPGGAARRAIEMARAGLNIGAQPRLCLAFANSIEVNVSQVLAGLTEALGPDVPVLGGASATDMMGPIHVREIFGGEVLDGSVVVLLLAGPLRYSYALRRGWTPVGTSHVATRTEGNLVIEIDGRPALEIFRRYLGSASIADAAFVHHPLAVFEGDSEDFYLRSGFAEGPVPGSLLTAGSVPQGATVRLTEYDREHVVEAARRAAELARADFARMAPEEPAAALVFTCSTRQTILGTWTPREVEALRETLPPETPLAGFYAFSEFAPFRTGTLSHVDNGSFLALLLGEEP